MGMISNKDYVPFLLWRSAIGKHHTHNPRVPIIFGVILCKALAIGKVDETAVCSESG
ncbi:MAG: hypothetical protein KC421_13495 [Anaerolineales bacterium]|nr:hypothetical protein [Anaerolineales bacterium]